MISIVVAKDKNGVIGKGGQLPWYLPADLAKFKKLTTGHPIIMGRKTFESIGRVLPGRTNIIVTRNSSWEFPGCLRAESLGDALRIAQEGPRDKEIFVIGGGEIFKEAISIADRLYVTEIDIEVAGGDVFFPNINPTDWREVERDVHEADEKNKYGYGFVVYERLGGAR